MKTFADRDAPVSDGLSESLRDIVRMYVVDRFQSEIWQAKFFTAGQAFEYLGIKVAGRIQWFPSGPDDVSRMQDGGGKSGQASFPQQIGLDGGFLNAVVAKRSAWRFFSGGNLDARSISMCATDFQAPCSE